MSVTSGVRQAGIAIVGTSPAGPVVVHLLQREAILFVVFERRALQEWRLAEGHVL